MKKNPCRSKAIKNKQHILANYPQQLTSIQQKYRCMNKYIKSFRTKPQDALQKVGGERISQKTTIFKIDKNCMNNFSEIETHRDKKMEEQTYKMKKQQSKSSDHVDLNQERCQRELV